METEDIKAITEEIEQKQNEKSDMEVDQDIAEAVKEPIQPEENVPSEPQHTNEDILKTLMDTDDMPPAQESEKPTIDEIDIKPTVVTGDEANTSIKSDEAGKKDKQEEMDISCDTAGNLPEPISNQIENSEPKINQDNIEKTNELNKNISTNEINKNISTNHSVQHQPQNTKDEVENALSALASAAINHGKEAEIKNEPVEPKDPKETWHTVGFIKGTSFNVQNYFYLDEAEHDLTEDQLPDISDLVKINLEPGTAYKFRVAAVNSVGRSDWSEISAFKTCVPGFPSAPSAIKIAKTVDGAHISWEPPKGEITEYSVYLAVRNSAKENITPTSMAFVRVYSGANNSCVVTHASLSSAYVDTTTKSAIIFRIAARNEKGYGPATQVRWLQDSINKAVKRPTDESQMALKKTRNE